VSRAYASPEAFEQALESHVRAAAQQRAFPVGRIRQLFIAERLLVRVHARFGDRVVTKGGLALEMRLSREPATMLGGASPSQIAIGCPLHHRRDRGNCRG